MGLECLHFPLAHFLLGNEAYDLCKMVSKFSHKGPTPASPVAQLTSLGCLPPQTLAASHDRAGWLDALATRGKVGPAQDFVFHFLIMHLVSRDGFGKRFIGHGHIRVRQGHQSMLVGPTGVGNPTNCLLDHGHCLIGHGHHGVVKVSTS